MANIFEDFINKFRDAQIGAQTRATYSADRAFNHVLKSPKNGVVPSLDAFLTDEQKAKASDAQSKWRVHHGAGNSSNYDKVWGFEDDKAHYSDIGSTKSSDTNKLTWRGYTVTPKGDEGASKNFLVGYDDKGRIAGVRDMSEDGSMYGYYGKDLLKSFFSQFDRDATSYKVWQNEDYGDGDGRSAIIFDSDKKNKPFIPSQIFKNRDLKPLLVTPPSSPSSLPKIDETFLNNYRSSK